MNRTGWAEMLRGLFRRPTRRLRSRLLARRQVAGHRVESLEQRRLLAVDFVSVSVMDGEPLYTAQLDQGLVPFAGGLTQSPQQVTLRFTPGTEIDPESLGGISIVRSGGRGDGFGVDGSLPDMPVQPGVLVVDDLPARNQVVIRFAETLPDDTYRFTISSEIDRETGTVSGLRTLDGQAFRGGGRFSFDVNISLGPQVVAVVPQPITRDADDLTAGLAQGRNTIEVYFNAAEQLNAASAESVGFYKLIEIDDANGEDVAESQRSPLRVAYDAASHRAVLEFAEGDLNDDRLYRLEIGGSGILADPQIIPGIVGDAGSSYATALPAGVIDEAGLVVSAAIDAEGSVSQPGSLPDLLYPDQPGSVDEPGHRHVPIDNSTHGLTEAGYATVASAGTQIETISFNFQTQYGENTQGNPLSNLITAEQKLRVREVFDLFSRYAGVQFVETAAEGITVAVGSTLVISDNSPVNSLEGLARGAIVDGVPTPDALAVINSGRDWGESEYGGAFFRAAMRQIGGVLGLWQSYDVPSVMGESLPGEGIFPSDNDLLHLQQLFPRSGTDIDLYNFSLAEAGRLTAETIAARQAGGASTLDTVVSVFGESYDTTATVAGVSTTVVGQTAVATGSSATVAGVDAVVTGVGARVVGGGTEVVGTSLTVTGTETNVIGLNERITGVAARVQGAEAVVQALPTRAVGSRASITAVAVRVAQAVTSSTTVFLEDVSAIAVGAGVIGLTGVPLDTTVEAINTLAKSVVLSNPVTVVAESLLGFSLTDGISVAANHFFVSDPSAVSVQVPVKLATGVGTTDFENADETVPTGTRVNAVEQGGIIEFSRPITVKLGDELGFGSTTAQVALDDVSNIPVGSRLGISTGDVAVDSARPLVVAVNRAAGVVTLSSPQTVAPGDLLAFDYNPADSDQLTAPVTARRFLVSGLTDSIVAGLFASSFQGIAANTTVESVDTDTGIVVFSRPVVLEVGATVGFGFVGSEIQLDDVTAVRAGAVVEGLSIPAGTTVSAVDAETGIVTLSRSVSVADGQDLGFSIPTDSVVTTNRIVVEEGGRTLTVGSSVSDATGADLDITVQRVEGRVVTLDGAVDLNNSSELLFGAAGRTFHVADTSGIQIGGLVTAATGVAAGVVVTSVDADTGRIMVSGDVALSHGDDVQFGVSGTSVVVGYDASVVGGVPVTGGVGVPEGTVIDRVVVNHDGSNQPASLTLTLSNRVSLPVGATLKTGFVGESIVVADLAGVEIGGLVTAEAGVDAGTRVLSVTSAAAGSGGTVTLDRAVAVEDGLVLGFGRQAASLLLNSSAYDGALVGSAVTVNGTATDVTVAGIVGNELTVQGGTGTLDVAHDDVIGFSFAGSLATEQVIVSDTTGLTVGGALDGASGTTITAVDRASGLVTLSAAESVTNNASLRFGFSGREITLNTVAAIDIGTPLTGAGLPDGVYVTAVDPVTKQVSLSKPVTVANGTPLDVGYGGNAVELPSVPSGVAAKTPISGPGIRPGTLVESVSGNTVILNQRVQVASGSPVGFGFAGSTSFFGFGSTTITVADIAGITVGAGVTGLPGQASGAVTVNAVDPTTNTVTLSANVTVPQDAVLEFGAVATNTIALADVAGLVVGTAVTGLGVPAGVTITGIDPTTSTVTLSETVTVSSGAILGLGTPRRELIARNNDAFGRDSFLKIDLEAGNYYVAVTSVGNTEFNPAVPHSGANGRTQGAYDLSLKFQPVAGAARTIVDASGTPLDGDRDGQAGGTFNFWFRTTAETNTLFVDKLSFDAATTVTVAATRSTTITVASTADITGGMELVGDGIPAGTTVNAVVDGTTLNLSDPVTVKAGGVLHVADSGSGTLADPYRTIDAAIAAAQTDPSKTIIRVAGNSGDELSGLRIAGTARSLRPNALESDINPHHYYIGIGEAGNELADGGSLIVPAGVTLMVDAGVVLRMRQANIDVGSSTELVSRSAAALQLLGVPDRPIRVTSAVQGAALNGPSAGPAPEGGDWGGIVLRADSDWQPDPAETLAHDTLRPFLNTINHAVIEYAGGRVQVDSELREFSAIQLEDARPSLGFNQILRSASNAISATPNSFLEAGGRAGPQFSGNVLRLNSTNGLFINIRTEYGVPLDTLDVAARFASTEVTYVLQESLILAGGAGSYFKDESGLVQPRAAGRLTIDPGVVLKLQNSRIELQRGAAQLLAEGTAGQPVVFTNFGDVRFGAGGTFDTNGNLPNNYGPGRWGGIILNAGSQASIDHAFVSGGGGEVPIEGVFDSFNVIEVHQGDLRLANSRLQSNSGGIALTDRTARGSNEAATVFIRGAQPVIVGNDFRDNAGATISINANSMTAAQLADPGRQTGLIRRATEFDSNVGPLIRDNRISYATGEPIVVGYGEPSPPPTADPPAAGTVQQIAWNGQIVDVLTNSWVVRAAADHAGAVEVQAGWSSESIGGGFHRLTAPGASVSDVTGWAEGSAQVSYVEPNFLLQNQRVASDPRYGELWGLDQRSDVDIDAPEAWDITTGSNEVVIAVIDSGVDYTHEDLAANIWVNPGEIAGDGIDNDGNGLIDDIRGWDFGEGDNDPMDVDGHGTHVAGTIGAVANNGVGVVGVAWNVRIMPLKFEDADGNLSTDAAIAAINYVTEMRLAGVNVVASNNSWGGGARSQGLLDAIEAGGQAGVLFVAAAGNSSNNNDQNPVYPASHESDAIISVAATDRFNNLAGFSNRGVTSVDIGAPGVDILSTLPGNAYGSQGGTSMAAPHVAGVAALVAAANPDATMEEIRDAILEGAVPTASLAANVGSGGLLNAAGALAAFRGVSRTAGVVIRGEEIVVDSVWDDTDIVHVLRDEIIVNNLHTATSLRLLSQADASLVVKLAGSNAGFTASGELTDIDDRVGGTVQVIGQPGFPVVLTSLADDSVGASLDAYGFPVTDTNVDGSISQPSPGDWRSLQFLPLSNDRNVGVARELELPFTTRDIDANSTVGDAEFLGTLAPNYATNGNTWESVQEKSGDENRRLGFDVSGTIAFNDPTDVDVYSFDGYAGSEVWVDIDQTSTSLDSMVEVLDASGRVLARSANSQADTGSVTGVVVPADPGGSVVVTGEEALVVGAAAAVTGVGAVVEGPQVTVTGVATKSIGYNANVIGVGARVIATAMAGATTIQIDDASSVGIGSAIQANLAGLDGIVAPGSTVLSVNYDTNEFVIDTPLLGQLDENEWLIFNLAGSVSVDPQTTTPGEPDNIISQAYRVPIAPNAAGTLSVFEVTGFLGEQGTLGSSDVDMYFLDIPLSARGATLDINVDTQNLNARLRDSVLRVFSATGAQLYRNDDSVGLDSRITFSVPPTYLGDGYYVGVSSYANFDYNPIVGGGDTGGYSGSYILRGSISASVVTQTVNTNFSRRVVFDIPPQVGAWVDAESSSTQVTGVFGRNANIAQTNRQLALEPDFTEQTLTEGFRSGTGGFSEHGTPAGPNTGIQSDGGRSFYRLLGDVATPEGRSIRVPNIAPLGWGELELTVDVNSADSEVEGNGAPTGNGDGIVIALQDASASVVEPGDVANLDFDSNRSLNQLVIHLDNRQQGDEPSNQEPDDNHISIHWGANETVVTPSFDWSDGEWRTLIVRIVRGGNGAVLNVSLGGEDIVTGLGLPGYTFGRATALTAGARSVLTNFGTHDISNIVVTAKAGEGTAGTRLLGLGVNSTAVSDVVFDNITAMIAGQTVAAGAATISQVSTAERVVTISRALDLVQNQLLDVSLPPDVDVVTRFLRVSDASVVGVGTRLSGDSIPFGTTVIDRNLETGTLELSSPITIGFGDSVGIGFVDATITVADTSALAVGMAVSGAGVPANTTVQFIDTEAGRVTLNQPIDVADGQYLSFGFVGVPVTTDTLYVDDTAVTIGAIVEAASAPGVALATVSAIDPETGAVTLSQPVTVNSGELLIFGLNGQAITARRVVVDNASGVLATVLVNEVGASAFDKDVPDGTTVASVEPVIGSGILELSGAVTVRTGDSLGFGFAGYDVVLDDVDGVALGETVGGSGVPVGTTVTGVNGNTVTLSAQVSVEDAALLTFTGQEFSLLPVAAAPTAVSVLPGSLSGVVYDGNTAIQTFTARRDGTLLFMPVGSPSVRATSGTVDYATGKVSLTFDRAPRRAVRMQADFDYGTLALTTLGFEPGTGNFGAYPLTKDTWRGGDFYTTNPRDAGMRLTLPGTQGTKQKYFIRVRSQPAAGASQSSYEANLVQASLLADGQTSGSYDLSVRLRQLDEAPGSTVRYADIRYPMIGIDVLGLPNNSPLVGTSGEHPDDSNNTFETAQPLGNLLTSDRNTISVAGEIGNEGDVDWYTFTLSYEDIQSLFGHNDGAKTWSTVFDIDYADGFRGDLTLSVFDDAGRLIYIGRDSNVADDQPGPGQEGGDIDDLSRGSVGKLDPFIGPAHLPAGSPSYRVIGSSGGAGVTVNTYDAPVARTEYVFTYDALAVPDAFLVEGGGLVFVDTGSVSGSETIRFWKPEGIRELTVTVTGPQGTIWNYELSPESDSVAAARTYYVAVSSNERLPAVLDQTFLANATDRNVRLEPVTSIQRVVEDHVGSTGYLSYTNTDIALGAESRQVESKGIFDVFSLDTHVRPFTLADVTLYVSTSNAIYTADAFTGGTETVLATNYNNGVIGDIDMRTDGRLYQYFGDNNNINDFGLLREINTGDGSITTSVGDGLDDQPGVPGATDNINRVDALAIRRSVNASGADEIYYSVPATIDSSLSALYRAQSTGQAWTATFFSPSGLIQGNGVTTRTTGLQFRNDNGRLYGVNVASQFYEVNPSTGETTNVVDFSGLIAGEGFQGLAAAPVNLEGGRYQGMFFAITGSGRLVCIDPDGAGQGQAALLADVFDTRPQFSNGEIGELDGIADSYISEPTLFGATGLAFSPLDINLWHVTTHRGLVTDQGHGVNDVPDGTRYPGNFEVVQGSQSLYFGLELDDHSFNHGVVGGVGYSWRDDLQQNPNIGDNYNLPGGAHGSLVASPFSLAGYESTDKPTLYFNYFLETDEGAANQGSGIMTDSARVFASIDGGASWELLATNNSARSAIDDFAYQSELPPFASVSSSISGAGYEWIRPTGADSQRVDTQHVQELFDNTGVWRQARVDLGRYAGESNIELRFDFSTAGMFDPTDTSDAVPKVIREAVDSVADQVNSQTVVTLDSVEGIVAGMVVRRNVPTYVGVAAPDSTTVPFAATVSGVDVASKTVTLETAVILTAGDLLAFFTPNRYKNNLVGFANEFGQFQSGQTATSQSGNLRGKDNAHEGFLVDDIMVGFAERGEIVANAAPGLTQFFDLGTPVSNEYPEQSLHGEYQLEIRRGTEYVSEPFQTSDSELKRIADGAAVVTAQFDTNTRFVESPLAPVHLLAENELNELDGIEMTHRGNGIVRVAAGEARLEPDPAVAGTSLNALQWNIDLSGALSAYLSFTAAADQFGALRALPATFSFTEGVPVGDGVAVSLDGGVNWQRVALLHGQGEHGVDLVAAVSGSLTDRTVIGFFQSGESGSAAGITISNLRVLTAPVVATAGSIGDSNNVHEFEQGQLIVQSNLITDAANYGVRIDAGRNEAVDPDGNYIGITNEPELGVARNLPVLNNPRLVPGAVVSNNVIAGAGTAGVVFSGTTSTQDQPQSVVPFGRIVNNTIYGGEGSTAVGVDVNEQAGPTILNNVFAELAVGVRVDASSRVDGQGNERTVVSASAFHAVGLEVAGVEQRLGQTLGSSPFVNAAGGNFYPTPGTAVVDSSLSAVQDRNEYRVVTESIGLSEMPIVAPIRDVYGQLRTDDPNQANVPGLGGTVFQDRGAVERVDQERPVGRIVSPLDQGSNPSDTDLTLDSVVVEGPDARGIGTMAIQLTDLGVGIDKSTVTSDAFVLIRDGIRLLDTIDYRWIYNENTDQVLFQATSVFPLGEYLIAIDSASADPIAGIVGRVTDRANNPIRQNVGGGTTAPATFSIRLLDAPGVPSRVVAAAGDGMATLGWIAPYSPPSIPVTRYDVQYSTRTRLENDDADWTDWTPSSGGTINVSPVEVDWPNNEDRVYRIRAVNAIGQGRWSDAVSATPSTPSVTAATPGKNSVTLHWTTPVNNGGRSIERYVIQRSVDEGATWIDVPESATGTTATVFGLPKGQPQRFKVAAVTSAGRGEWSNETADIEPQGVPDAPTALTSEIDPTDGSVILSWTAPENIGGATISGYELTYELADESGTPVTIPGIVSPNYDLAGLQRGTRYTITVAAVNVHGAGESSQSVTVTAPDVIQNAPSITAVVSGLGSVEVSWRSLSVPEGDLPLTGYVVQSKPESAPESDWATSATVLIEDGTSYKVTGLTRAGGPYLFRVAARNTLAGVVDNDLTFSNESAAVTPIEISGVVENLTAVPGNEQVSLVWEPPADDGGGQLIDYRVEAKASSETDWSVRSDGVTATPGATVLDLQNGLEYQFRVTPITRADTGEEFDGAAAETAVVMPFGPPTAVTNLVATSGVEQVTLDWGAPVSSGGRAVTHYVVEYANNANGPWTVFADDQNAADFTATLPDPVNQDPDLVKGTEYFFRVLAVNDAGNGPVSAVVSATPTGLPDQPVGFAFTPDQADGSLQVTWTAPANTGALPVTYELEYRRVGEVLWAGFDDATPSDLLSDLPGLSRGADYEVRVRAKNDVGYSPWLNGSFTAPDVPAAPTGLVASLPSPDAIGVVQLTWAAPALGNDVLPVTDYVIQQSTNDGDTWETLVDGVSTTTSYTVSELLRADGGHIFRVAAKNILPGVTDPNVLNFTPATAPVIPLALSEAVDNLDVNTGDQQVTLTWSAPADSGGVSVTNYLVEQNDGSGAGWQVVEAGTSTVLSRMVTGLTNGKSYQFRVTPQTSLGDGLAATSQVAVPFGLPTAPTNLQVSGGVGKLTASWDAATGNGRVITDYVIQYRQGTNGDWVTYVDGTNTNLEATLVAPTLPTGVDLYVRVAAVNEGGTGPFTAAAGPVIATAVPDAPTAVVASVNSNGSIGLTWTAPASDGGSTITDYVVQYRQTASSVWVTYADGISTASSAVVSGLERLSGPYLFRVMAKNDIGTGAASTQSNAITPLGVPGVVQSLNATRGNGQVQVSWQTPADDGGAVLTDYLIEYKQLSAVEWTTHGDGIDTERSATITELQNGVSYVVRVRAVNSVGQGAWASSAAIMPVTQPGVPTALAISVDSGQASLSWTAPAGGGLAVNDYVVQYRLASASDWITWNDGVTANPAATITNLTNGLQYVFRVKATTSAFPHDPANPGDGDWAVSGSRVIGPKAVAPPVAAAQKYGNGMFLTWNRITPPAGFSVLSYQVEYYDSAAGEWLIAGQADPRANSLLIDGTNLDRGTYTLRVAAVTSVGVGHYRVSNPVTL